MTNDHIHKNNTNNNLEQETLAGTATELMSKLVAVLTRLMPSFGQARGTLEALTFFASTICFMHIRFTHLMCR